MGESGGGGMIGGRYSCAGACPEAAILDAWPRGRPPLAPSNREPPLPGLVLPPPLTMLALGTS